MNVLIAADYLDEPRHGFHDEAGEIRRLVRDDGQGKQAEALLREIEVDLCSRFGADNGLSVYFTTKRTLIDGETAVRHNVSIVGPAIGRDNNHWCRLSDESSTLTALRAVLPRLYDQVAQEVRVQRAIQKAIEEEGRRREEQQVAHALSAL